MSGQPLKPSDAEKMYRTLQKSFSGYVHGAYVHIMEVYGGSRKNLHYRMRGMSNTPRITEWIEALSSYVYRTMIAVEVVAKRCKDAVAAQDVKSVWLSLEAATDIGMGDQNDIT